MKRSVKLIDIRRRLELLLKALHGREFEIITDRTPKPKWLERIFSDVRAPIHSPEPVALIQRGAIVLPAEIPEERDAASPEDRYRLLALAAAEREVRGTLDVHAELATPLERELFWIHENNAIDAAIVEQLPSLDQAIHRARARHLATRPNPKTLSPQERALELRLREALSAPPVKSATSACAVLSQGDASTIERSPGGFSGIRPVGHWGICPRDPIPRPDTPALMLPSSLALGSVEVDAEGESGNAEEEGRGDNDSNTAATDDDPDRPSLGSGSASEARRLRLRRTGTPFKYAEWDYRKRRHIPEAVTVWTQSVQSSPSGDAIESPMTRALRAEFQQLRVHRESRRRQYSGDSLDLPAVVDGLVDRRMGRTPDERVYEDVRVNRPSLAIALLVDTSGSTGNPLADGQRILDLEKAALLMAHEGLDAVGDAYAIYTFSSYGATDVQVLTVKGFDERGSVVRTRVDSLHPDQNTRLGAAIRHVTRVLGEQPAAHQLLLVVTDGRPSDVHYDEEFGVADTRQAILDARNRGVSVFGLAIDLEEHGYLSELFGASGYVWVRDPHALGRQLIRAIRNLLRR